MHLILTFKNKNCLLILVLLKNKSPKFDHLAILKSFKVKKAENQKKKEAEDAEATLKKAEEAKKITIEEDKSLAEPKRIKILKGESLDQWSTKKFVMYKNGPKWRPPILNFKIHGMPEQDAAADDDFGMLKRFHLNKEQQQQKRKQPSPSFQPIGHGMKRY